MLACVRALHACIHSFMHAGKLFSIVYAVAVDVELESVGLYLYISTHRQTHTRRALVCLSLCHIPVHKCLWLYMCLYEIYLCQRYAHKNVCMCACICMD